MKSFSHGAAADCSALGKEGLCLCCSCHILLALYVAEQGSCILHTGQGVFAVLVLEPIRGAGQGAVFALCVGNGFFLVCDQEFCSFLCCHHGAEVVLLLWLMMG